MNSVITRAITAERKRLLMLSPKSLLQLQQHSSSTSRTRKTSKIKAPEVESPPSGSFSQEYNPKESLNRPKPSEIQWQSKVVNSVNLTGQVMKPLQFKAASDGKYLAGTIICQEHESPSSPPFCVPIIFEGDLAHSAVMNLREKDFVHVAGHLRVDVSPFKLSEDQPNVQVMVHSINFVQGSQSETSASFNQEEWTAKSADDSATPNDNISTRKSLEELDSKSNQLGLPKQDSTDATLEHKDDGSSPKIDKSAPDSSLKGVESLSSVPNAKVHKKGTDASWSDLIDNPDQWVDNREKKLQGLVKAKYPDFTHKVTRLGLWLNSAPAVVFHRLKQLETNMPPETAHKGEKDGDSWKHLVENPSKWWDNRATKTNKRGPDFKNKDSGKALWLGNAPAWALSSLPPLRVVDEKKAGTSLAT